MLGVVLEIGYTAVLVHNLKRVVPEHFKTVLAFKEAHHAHQHGKRFAKMKKSLEHRSFHGIGRVAYDVIALGGAILKKSSPVAMWV